MDERSEPHGHLEEEEEVASVKAPELPRCLDRRPGRLSRVGMREGGYELDVSPPPQSRVC